MTKILLVEDDPNLAYIVKDNLSENGFLVKHCDNGMDAEHILLKDDFDLYLFDVMMPKKDGFSLAESIRGRGDQTPIIFITAREMAEDKIKGFTLGADDYITKPFNFSELVLRIEAILKRVKSNNPQVTEIEFGKCLLKTDELRLRIQNEWVTLTKKESALLEYLAKNANQAVKREDMLRSIWKDDSYFAGRSMDVYITKLRKYLKNDPSIDIQNVHGVGFKMLIR
jgi:DNA-binding response OmpR family regulator